MGLSAVDDFTIAFAGTFHAASDMVMAASHHGSDRSAQIPVVIEDDAPSIKLGAMPHTDVDMSAAEPPTLPAEADTDTELLNGASPSKTSLTPTPASSRWSTTSLSSTHGCHR
jgi:hypothetical protein